MDKHQFPTSLPSSDVSLSNSILSLVIFLWGVQFFRGSLLFSVHFGASNVANFILGTAIRPKNMTGNSTKRMNEFAMRRTTDSGKEGELKRRENWLLSLFLLPPSCCALLRSCLREIPKEEQAGICQGRRQRQASGREGGSL